MKQLPIDDLMYSFEHHCGGCDPNDRTPAFLAIVDEFRRRDAERTDLARRLGLAEAEIECKNNVLQAAQRIVDSRPGGDERMRLLRSLLKTENNAAAGVGAGGEKGGDGA